MKLIQYILIIALTFSCSSEDRETLIINNTHLLSADLENRAVELNSVIACAASDSDNPDVVEVYFYPEQSALNFKLYETNTANVDANDFSNYRFVDLETFPFFNDTLLKFVRPFATEQWIIVTYELEGEIKISTPIRTKNVTQPTERSSNITINQEISGMPIFSWEQNTSFDNAIFFQVLSTIDEGFLSGTYTIDNQFQYYNTSNVVLNITNGSPPSLTQGIPYKFTVMDVSTDNWVNAVFVTEFITQ